MEALPDPEIYSDFIVWERPVQIAAAHHIKPQDVVFDIGANIGALAIAFARKVGPSGKVVAVEANPRNAAWTRRDVSANSVSNIEVVEAAIWSQTGETLNLSLDPSYYGAASSLVISRSDSTVEVRTTTIDALVARFGAPSLIKIDVEGAESAALLGAQQTIRVHRPTFLLEVTPNVENPLPILEQAGYNFWDVNTMLPIEASDADKEAFPINVIALPKERGAYRTVERSAAHTMISHVRIGLGDGIAALEAFKNGSLAAMYHTDYGHLAHHSCGAIVTEGPELPEIRLRHISGPREGQILGVTHYGVVFDPR